VPRSTYFTYDVSGVTFNGTFSRTGRQRCDRIQTLLRGLRARVDRKTPATVPALMRVL
jgi:hypothetical protein